MNDDQTKEPQYNVCVELREKQGLPRFGLMSGYVWHDDPKRLVFMLSRYKFVSKMLGGRDNVLEVGCGDGFGSRIVRQSVGKLTGIDFDPVFIEDGKQIVDPRWPVELAVHDIMDGPVDGSFDGIYSLDVMEHIPASNEHRYIENLHASLSGNGILIVGMPSLESQNHASPASKAGHVNCKSGLDLKAAFEAYFDSVLLFSMNDEVVHTGFHPLAHYLFVICSAKRTSPHTQ
ncbi:class I SAM-dependent methyltransferase [Thalassospiraceae bacterium LMO-JJ14]|nr:class I SAM-dependent methyltransferase [Thalassospiraceae bacterium LMO-JJ14]